MLVSQSLDHYKPITTKRNELYKGGIIELSSEKLEVQNCADEKNKEHANESKYNPLLLHPDQQEWIDMNV